MYERMASPAVTLYARAVGTTGLGRGAYQKKKQGQGQGLHLLPRIAIISTTTTIEIQNMFASLSDSILARP